MSDRPHQPSDATVLAFESVLSWECQTCGEWVRNYGPPPGPCPGVPANREATRG